MIPSHSKSISRAGLHPAGRFPTGLFVLSTQFGKLEKPQPKIAC
jgi:hypothetical protein